MYNTIQTPDIAVCHLFIYCCFKDGEVKEEELDDLAARFTALGMHRELNFKDEMIRFRSYKSEILNERDYLKHLITAINPTNELALLSYCIDLMLSDESLDPSEEQLITTLSELFEIKPEEEALLKKLQVQRKVVSTQQFF